MFQESSTSRLHLARQRVLVAIVGIAALVAACGGSGGNGDSGPGWTMAALLEEANGPVARPEVVVDGEDNATVVFSQFDGSNDRVYARRYSADGTLGEAVALSASGVDVMSPEAGVDGAGNVFAAWVQLDGGSMSLRSSIYSPASEVWSVVQAQVSGVPDISNVRLAVDADGTATVAWYQHGSGEYYNFACRFTASTPCSMGTRVELEHNTGGNLRFAELAAGPGGSAMAVWTSYPMGGATYHIRASYFDGNAWSAAEEIDAGLGNSRDPHVAIDGDGTAMAVWAERTGDENAVTPYYIRSRSYLAATGWAEDPLTLEAVGAGSAENPQVTFDSSGNAVVVWDEELGGDTSRLRFSRHTASGWGDLADLDGGSGGNYGAKLTVDASGNITVAWDLFDGTRSSVVANRYEPESGWGDVTTLSAADQGDAGEPSVASDSRGHAIVVWEQDDAAGDTTDGWFSVYQ